MAHYANSKALSKGEKQPYEEAIMPIIVVNNESNSVMATFTGPVRTSLCYSNYLLPSLFGNSFQFNLRQLNRYQYFIWSDRISH